MNENNQEDQEGWSPEIPVDSGAPIELSPLVLSDQQQALNRSLLEKAANLATMYAGSLYVLRDTANPDRFALAAHGIRELMEKVPIFLDIETKAHKENLKSKINELEDRWKATLAKTTCCQAKEWCGTIDAPLCKMLTLLHTFFEWFSHHSPRRKAEIAETLRGLDGSGRCLPKPLEDLNIRYWEEIRDFFQAVSHHLKNPTPEDFNTWLDALERFLLERLRPRTFVEMAAIDEILKESEGDA